MIDNPETDAVDETYDHQETDPSKCGAISSSLWEIVSLQEHVLPQVKMSSSVSWLNQLIYRLQHIV